LAIHSTAANVHEVTQAEMMVDAIPGLAGQLGRPRRRPTKLHADKAYDSLALRQALQRRGIQPRIARRRVDSSERLGRHRWVVERSFAWLNQYRRLRIRYERRQDIHEAFLKLGCALICLKFIDRFC
jgi:transposase